ncbi:CoA-binding protein [Silicimonas algicola]|uniref:CoA-binding domain-containing protein n=1 Tax=Silicimonas algicola TaxID=1826607 RepID=A0A316GD20_9RHOB|nr:CoA-binding protein [Silicimonas algicola]AZQ66146.1 CoA-binding protein [Silicimonas algicola]PWK58453.1 hypothetical protein C8D95_101267 [Silicimonas algicola]
MDHAAPYPPYYIRDILDEVKTIAVVGASPKPGRPSYGVMRRLIAAGYNVIPVNPGQAGKEILDRKVVATLADIDGPVDMVDVFRERSALKGVADQAVAIGARVLWTQLDLVDPDAARLAEDAGLKVVMDRCPAIELRRLGR